MWLFERHAALITSLMKLTTLWDSWHSYIYVCYNNVGNKNYHFSFINKSIFWQNHLITVCDLRIDRYGHPLADHMTKVYIIMQQYNQLPNICSVLFMLHDLTLRFVSLIIDINLVSCRFFLLLFCYGWSS